jgi:hypothetical protein
MQARSVLRLLSMRELVPAVHQHGSQPVVSTEFKYARIEIRY